MRGMLRFAAQNVPRKMEGRSAARQVPDSLCSGESFWNRPHNGTDFDNFKFQFLWDVSHEALFSHLQLSALEGNPTRKRHFHIFNFHFLREVSQVEAAVHARQGCSNEFLLIFLVCGGCHFPCEISFQKAYFFGFWCRAPVLEQVLGQKS